MGARERRLWWTVALVLAAIYATVDLAQTFLLALRGRGWLGPSVWTLVACAALAVVVLVARARPRPPEIVLFVVMAVLYGWILARLDIIQERIHFVQYGLVAGLAYEALAERWRGRPGLPWRAAAGAALVAALAGWVDEGIQALRPNRVYDLRDVGFNALAGVLVALTMALRSILRAGVRAGSRAGSR